MADRKTLPLMQSPQALATSAGAADQIQQGVCAANVPRAPGPGSASISAAHQSKLRPNGCAQRITLAIFFDGTGNNLDADEPTEEHSNVARLFRAHPLDDPIAQIYARYVPGLGTYFREIGDPGGTLTGSGAGSYGQARLDWAFKELAQLLQRAEARASNPSNPITEVKLAVFGFSRGAALARAFCRDLQRRCEPVGGRHTLRAGVLPGSGIALKGGYPVEVYFLGLFDTVASVGLPMSANNFHQKRRSGLGWRDFTGHPLAPGSDQDLERLAFGAPGADPAPGSADGHASWANGLQIPPMVSRCVHMVAAHEMRNSFPLDSALDGTAYPPGVSEMVYPGVHSDVGGGYREGEGGKSAMLARMPLRAMLQAAIEAGVPLFTMEHLPSNKQKKDFAIDDHGARDYAAMMILWREYMRSFGGSQPLGAGVLAHMAVYWRYRLTVALERSDPANAARRNARGRPGRPRTLTDEQQTIRNNERAFAQDRARLDEEYRTAQSEYVRVSMLRDGAEQALQAARSSSVLQNQVPALEQRANELRGQQEVAHDKARRAKAKLDTAANDAELIANLDKYDAWLLEDAQLLHRWRQEQPRRRMRPHYQALAEAYQEVVVEGRRMATDSAIYRFFNRYVHDSLAGFDKDNTRPSDPRVLYVGGDAKKRYAAVPGTRHAEALPA